MKNSAQILSHLRHQPQFLKLAQHECIQSVQKLFPPHLQRMIRFAYIRNQILFFVFNHPGAKQEFDIIIDSIKTPLKTYPPKTCEKSPFDDIRAFVTHQRSVATTEDKTSEMSYKERSSGSFSNPASSERLYKIIEKIRESIHARAD